MTELIKYDKSLPEMEEQGRKLYRINKNYRNIATVMEDPEFRNFYTKYMDDLVSIRTIMMFLKLYEKIEKKSKIQLTPYQKIFVLDQIMRNGKIRENMAKYIMKWSSDSFSNDKNHKCIEMNTDSTN